MIGWTRFCIRRSVQRVVVDWRTSKSAILPVRPLIAASLAIMRQSVDFPTPPFCEAVAMMYPMKSLIGANRHGVIII